MREHLDFIEDYGDGYIAPSTDVYVNNPVDPDHILFEVRDGRQLVGIGFVSINGYRNWRSITVVHPDYRNQGIGSNLLARRIKAVKRLGLEYQTQVLATNAPSLAMCEKHLQAESDPTDKIQKFRTPRE